jgi:predicted permease
MTRWLRRIQSRVRSLVLRDRLDRQFDEELATHLELLIDDARRRGLPADDARREALLKLGRPESLREQHRDARGLPWVDALRHDARYAVRMLRKAPAFTAVVTLTLALGIGANTALFSLVDSLLLRSLPVRDPDRLVQVNIIPVIPGGFKKGWIAFDRPVFDRVRAQERVVSEAVGFMRLDRPLVLIDGAAAPAVDIEEVSENYFRDLGIAPIVGRTPVASDDNVAVISESCWRSLFGKTTSLQDYTLRVNGKSYEIIGVAPSRFGGFNVEHPADVWLTSPMVPSVNLMMIARLHAGVSPAQAQAALQPIGRQVLLDILKDLPSDQAVEIDLVPAGKGLSQLRGQYRGALLALMALVTLVLLTTCTNVGNLLMLKNAARRRELTVRAALGAGRGRLIAQYFIESTILAAAGCAAGLFLASWGVSAVLAMLPLPALPDGLAFQWDAHTVGFAAGVALLSALLFGLAPAWRATEVDLSGALRTSQGVTTPARTRRLGRILVGCQVGLSVLLLVGAGLFVQTVRNLATVDIGYDIDRLMQVSIDTRFAGYKQGEVGAVYRRLLERVGAVPGVRSATGVRNPLMRRSGSRTGARLPGLENPNPDSWESVEVGPRFFETMGIEVVRGRAFTAADFDRGSGVFVVNEAFARHYYPNEDPLLRTPAIVGIVRDVRLAAVRSEIAPLMYEVSRREPDRINALEVRVAGDPAAIAPAIRRAIQDVNPRLFVGIRTFGDDIDRDIAKERMVATISAFFSALGLTLAAIGIFGVASSTVAHRAKELGIRRALGAGQWSVIRESLRETLVVFGLGLAAGAIAAFVAVRLTSGLIADLLFGLTATDAANIAAALAVMAGAALLACLLPALRATRIDPLTSIREE